MAAAAHEVFMLPRLHALPVSSALVVKLAKGKYQEASKSISGETLLGPVTLPPTESVTAFPGVLSPSMAKRLMGPKTVFHSENTERLIKMLHGGTSSLTGSFTYAGWCQNVRNKTSMQGLLL